MLAQRAADDAHADPYLVDMARGAANGPGAFMDSASNLLSHLDGEKIQQPVGPLLGETSTLPGAIAQGISTFATGLLAMGGNPFSGVEGAAGLAGRSAVDFGITFTGFKGDTGRLSDGLYETFKGTPVANVITDYLHSDQNDNFFEQRLKTSLENLGIGSALGLVFKGVTGIKGMLSASTPDAAAAIAKQIGPDMAESLKQWKAGTLQGLQGINETNLPHVISTTVGVPLEDAVAQTKALKAVALSKGVNFNTFLQNAVQGVRKGVFDPISSWQDGQLGEAPSKIGKVDAPSPSAPPAAPVDLTPPLGSPKASTSLTEADSRAVDKMAADYSATNRTQTPTGTSITPKPMSSDSSLFFQSDGTPTPKGAVHLLTQQGKGVISLFENADATTWSHEIGHLLRYNLPQSQLDALESAFGTKLDSVGRFPEALEEQFANAVQQKVHTGSLADPVLDNAVSPIAKGVTQIYNQLTDSGMKPSDALKAWFDAKPAQDVAQAAYTGTPDQNMSLAKGLMASLDGPVPSKLKADTGVNLMTYNETDPVEKIMAKASQYAEQYIKPALQDSKSLDMTEAGVMRRVSNISSDTGIPIDTIVARSKAIYGSVKNLDVAVGEIKYLTASLGRETVDAAQTATSSGAPEDILRFAQMASKYQEVMANLRGTQLEAGRGVNAFKYTPDVDTGANLQKLVQSGAMPDVIRMASDIGAMDSLNSSPRSIIRVIEDRPFWNTVNYLRGGAMLSSPSSLAHVALSMAIKTAISPLENIAGGTGRGLMTGDFSLASQSVGTYVGLVKYVGTALKAASDAFMNPDASSNFAPHSDLSPGAPISANAYGLTPGSNVGTAVDYLGRAVGLGYRFHMANAEFFQVLNYHAYLYSKAVADGMTSGLSGDALASHVESSMSGVLDDLGRGKDSDALNYAKQQTYTQPVTSGFGKTLLDTAQAHPWLRLITPFLSIANNAFSDIVGHTPVIGAILKQQSEALKLGGNARAAVLGKWAMGGTLYTGAYLAAQQGLITGSGGPNKGANATARLAGFQPYSVKVPDGNGGFKYFSYNRADPIGAFFGLAADYHELAPYMKGTDTEKVTTAMLASLANNVGDRTFLKGLTDATAALHDPSQDMSKYVQGIAASFVPSALNAVNPDPAVRDVQSMMDAIKAKIPGLSETLQPKRNVLGEVINKGNATFASGVSPIAYSETSPDPVKREIASLSKGMRNPEPTEFGTDLSQITLPSGQSAYDRRLELIGQTKVGGLKLNDALKGLIKSPQYQTLVNGGTALLPQRQTAVESVLNSYRTQAFRQLLSENPTIAKQMQQTKMSAVTNQVSSLKTALFNLKQQGQQ